MAGVALLLDLLKHKPAISSKALHSCGFFTATVAASAAAASVAGGRSLASRFLFGDGGITVALCDAGAVWNEDYITSLRPPSEIIFQHESIKYSTKYYPLELKPLFSAFVPRSIAVTSLRSFLTCYLPLLEHKLKPDEDDDDDFLGDPQPTDLVTPFKKSLKQILHEVTVVTTRRVLERVVVHYASSRTAWKLLKDAARSAKRKAIKGMPSYLFFWGVSKTTFRAQVLAVAASWLVQVGVDSYRVFRSTPTDKNEQLNAAAKVQLLRRKVLVATIRCSSSLLFASLGAGIGATLVHPSMGQWIGCTLGDYAGPILIVVFVGNVPHLNL
ncbi:hypothetical protein H6P81_005634 [Aristolochia fimbriata]|uniref:Uncharacterized protein n=1 Tax=Aristolochia fimbriata TaxID=158543 RepID=A0AAV7EV08_ARIFI|nr:hypothetical protein H6P81_005634 [Aristolochia fimbriata]